jgi:hypothetical protein
MDVGMPRLNGLDFVWLAPGTAHLVDARCEHTTQVLQTPPALSDQILLSGAEEAVAQAAL